MTVYDDEIDLRPYIVGLIRKWWVIVLLSIIGAAIGFALSRKSPERYQAVAIILLTKQTSKLNLTSQLPTITEPTSAQSRTDTILTIAESNAVALQVWEAIEKQKTISNLPDFRALKGLVTFVIQGDTLKVTALSADQALAEILANQWAQTLVDTVNLIYSGEQPLSIIQSQRESAQTDYETAQTALEYFLQTSQIEALEQKISSLNILSLGATNDLQNLYAYYQNRKNEMLALQIQADALKQQIEQGSQSAAADFGDALAILITRAAYMNLHINHVESDSVYETSTGNQQISTRANLGSSVAIQLSDLEFLRDDPQNYIADIETIISQAQTEQTKAETALQSLSQSVLDKNSDPTADEVFTQLREAKAQLENERSAFATLKTSRDLSLTAYQTLLAKEAEIKNTPKSSNFMVMLSPAMLPETPISRNPMRNMAIAGAFGFFLSTFIVLAFTWWKSANIFDNEQDKKSSKQVETEA
jgi:capsular polysaccharide biosynthesis protein